MELLNACFTFALFTVLVLFLFLRNKFDYWKKKGVYTEPPSFIFGNAKNLVTQNCHIAIEFLNLYNKLKEKLLPFGGYYFLTKPIFVPVDLDLVKKILTTDFENFTDHSMHVQDYEPLSQHLFALKGSKWKTMRAKLSPAFTASKNKILFDTVLKTVAGFMEIIEESAVQSRKIDVNDLSSRYVVDVISSCVFGFDCNSLKNPDSEVRKVIMKLFDPSFRNTVLLLLGWLAPKVLGFFKIRFYQKAISDFFINFMETTVNYRESNNVTRPDFVDLLLHIRRNDENPKNAQFGNTPSLTTLEMASHSLNFFIAGYESSSTIIMSCLYELALDMKIQDKARREIQKSFQEHATEGQMNHDVVQSLPYIEQVVSETMRKYPTLPVFIRECTKDYVIPGTNVKIEKGCLVFIPYFGILNDPDIYPNGDQFDPERFSSEEIKKRHSGTWLPFGLGPRKCIAYQFGVMEVKTVISSLLLEYQWTIDSQTEQPMKLSSKSVLFRVENEIWINFKKL